MGLNKAISVRLDADIRHRLERLAQQSGVKASFLMRQAVRDYVIEVERAGSISVRVDENSGTVIGQQNFTSGASQRGDAPYKRRRAKK